MSDHDNDPLPPDLLNTLRSGRPGRPVPSEERDYLLAALGPLMWPGLPTASSPQGDVGHEPKPVLPEGHASTASAGLGALAAGKATMTVGGILAGVVFGVVGHMGVEHLWHDKTSAPGESHAATSSEPQGLAPGVSTAAETPLPAPSASERSNGSEEPMAGADSATADRPSSIAVSIGEEARSRARDDSLNAERALVDAARTALSRGQTNAATEALRRHQRLFPHGRLAEERDALWVQTLGLAGREGEARERADLFRKQYPGSLMTPNVSPSSSASNPK